MRRKMRRLWTRAQTDMLIRMREVEHASWRRIALQVDRTASACEVKYAALRPPPPKALPGVGASKVTPQAVAALNASKQLSPVSITAFVFGDPLPGRSALDRRSSSS